MANRTYATTGVARGIFAGEVEIVTCPKCHTKTEARS